MDNNFLIVIVFAMVAGMLGSALFLTATDKQGPAIVGGAIVSIIFWLAVRFMHS
jgi:hypothetical protein